MGLISFSINKQNLPQFSRKFLLNQIFLVGSSFLVLIDTLFDSEKYDNNEKTGIGSMVDFLQLLFMKFGCAVILLESFYHHKTVTKYFIDLCKFDARMKQNGKFSEINRQERHNGFKMNNRTVNYCTTFMAMTFYVGCQLTVLSMVTLRGEEEAFDYWFAYITPFIYCCVRYFQIVNFVWFIKKRLELLNSCLSKTDLTQSNTSRLLVCSNLLRLNIFVEPGNLRQTKEEKSFNDFLFLREMYHELFKLSNTVNDLFGYSIVINISNGFIATTLNSYFVFLRIDENSWEAEDFYKVVESICWCLPHLVNLVALSAICYATAQAVS